VELKTKNRKNVQKRDAVKKASRFFYLKLWSEIALKPSFRNSVTLSRFGPPLALLQHGLSIA